MKKLALILSLLTGIAFAQLPFNESCIRQDSLSIRDQGNHVAIVIYYNSVENCSKPAQVVQTAPNGIQVLVTIELGGHKDQYKELIILEPLTSGYISLPPDSQLLDGEKQEFEITTGLS